MVSGISQVGQQGYIGSAGNPVYVQQANPGIAYAPDTVEISGKKSGAKKGILAAIGTAIVAAGALFWGVKSGKLTKVDNPTKWTQKLQNFAFNAGDKLVQGYDKVKSTDVFAKGKEYLTKGIDWVKGLFGKKTDTVA